MKFDRPSWFDRGICTGKYPQRSNPFFPQVRGGRFDQKTRDRAVSMCDGCPVKSECLDYARSIHGVSGIWGGVVFYGPSSKRQPLTPKKCTCQVQSSAPACPTCRKENP